MGGRDKLSGSSWQDPGNAAMIRSTEALSWTALLPTLIHGPGCPPRDEI